MKLTKLLYVMIVAALMLAACVPGQTQTPGGAVTEPAPLETPAVGAQAPAPVTEAAAAWLAGQLGLEPGDVVLKDVEEVEWQDGCLGLGGPAESCLLAITPGYRITFEVNGASYEIRTDLKGEQFRSANPDLPKGGPIMVPDPQSEAAQQAAARALAEQLGIDVAAISITNVEAVDWPDSCLGVHRPEEMCLAAITPGYRILLEADGQVYQVNTNLEGSAFRVLDQPSDEPVTGGAGEPADPDAAVQAAREYLAQQLGISEETIEMVTLEAADWPDSCLGINTPGIMCAQVITPGFRIILDVDGRQYEFHTDQAGGQVAAALTPLPRDAEETVIWESTEGDSCQKAVIGAQSVQFGACGEELQAVDLPDERQAEVALLYGTYASFDGETPAGKVMFIGGGAQKATEAEMRSVAEWAALVLSEVTPVRGEREDGLVITYHREGGIAGFCSDAYIYRSGWVQTASCKGGGQTLFEPYRLDSADLERLYTWVDTLESFEVDQKDPATADAMTVRVTFEGSGDQEATADQQSEIMQFADRANSGAPTR